MTIWREHRCKQKLFVSRMSNKRLRVLDWQHPRYLLVGLGLLH
jgi:hypothetical protein